MGKKKTMVIVSIAVLVLLITIGVTYSVVILMNRDREAVLKAQDDVKKTYKEFKSEADLFVDARSDFTTNVLEDLYVESVEEDYKEWIEYINAYQGVVDKVIEKASPVGKVCIGKNYPDHEVHDNCNAYMNNYETIMNYFVKDMNTFNQFMEKYYKDYKGDSEKYPKIKLDSKYHYIDVNQDGKFIAKDE